MEIELNGLKKSNPDLKEKKKYSVYIKMQYFYH